MNTPPTKSAEAMTWQNPLFKDVPAFLERLNTFIDMFGSAHVALPRTRNKKFLDAINEKGYKMESIDAKGSEMLTPAQTKKLKFYAISRLTI